MTLMGNAAEADQKMAGVTGHTEKGLASLPCFPNSLSLDSEHWKPDTLVRPEKGTKTLQPELWSSPIRPGRDKPIVWPRR